MQERGWAQVADGTRVPLSIVRRADVALDGSAPAVLYGYGSYEASMDPGFSISRLSLLDRGIVYAIAHVRGGGDRPLAISADGRFVPFESGASNLVAGGTNGEGDVLVRDRRASRTERASVGRNGAQGNGFSGYPTISGNGPRRRAITGVACRKASTSVLPNVSKQTDGAITAMACL